MKTVSAAIVLAAALTSSAHAYLGSFGPQDGYAAQYGTVYGNVTYFNAGQNGLNAGGGAMTFIPADSGLWKQVSPVGSSFGNFIDRANFAATYPAYAPTPPNTIAAYAVGGHFPGHNNDGFNFAMRNDTPLGTGANKLLYSLDTYDFGGINPTSVTTGPVSQQFYFVPSLLDNSAASNGTVAREKFTMSVGDNAGNIGFQWGYARDNTVLWRTSPSGSWNYTSMIADQNNWDGVKFNIDLTADTFGIDYFDASANSWGTLVPAGTPMGAAMNNFSRLGWQLEDGVSGNALSIAGKNYFDDFSFVVAPEPTSLTILAASGVLLRRRRR